MKKTLLALMTLFMVVSCGQQSALSPTASTPTYEPTVTKNVATLTPSQTQNPTETPSPSFTETPSITPTGTLTEWTRIYPTKQILVFYGAASNTEISAMFEPVGGNFDINPFLILYTDGQLILYPGYEKQLSQEEIDDMLAKLEQFGFFQIKSTFPADEQNPIYTFPNGIAPSSSGLATVKFVEVDGQKSNAVGYMADWKEYLNQPMKDVITYLEGFSTEGATRYKPGRLLVGAKAVQETTGNDIVIPWPGYIPPPLGAEDAFYLEGAQAVKLYNLMEDHPNAFFIYKGTKYWLFSRPVYPHECRVSHFTFRDNGTASRSYFFCDEP